MHGCPASSGTGPVQCGLSASASTWAAPTSGCRCSSTRSSRAACTPSPLGCTTTSSTSPMASSRADDGGGNGDWFPNANRSSEKSFIGTTFLCCLCGTSWPGYCFLSYGRLLSRLLNPLGGVIELLYIRCFPLSNAVAISDMRRKLFLMLDFGMLTSFSSLLGVTLCALLFVYIFVLL